MRKWINIFLSPYRGFSKNTWKVIAAGFINSIGLTLALYISLYLNSLNYQITQIGLTVSLFGFGGLVGGYLGGYLTDKYSALTICKFSLFVSTLFLFIFPLASHFILINIICLFLGLSSNLFRPAFILALANGEEIHLDRIIAFRRVAINLGMAFGAAIFSLLISEGFIILFWIYALASLAAFFILTGVSDSTFKSQNATVVDDEKQKNLNFHFIILLMFLVLLVFNQNQVIYPLFLKNEIHISMHFLSLLFTLNGVIIALLQMPITSILSNKCPNISCAWGAMLICFGFAITPFCKFNIIFSILSCVFWSFGEIILFPALLSLIIKLSGHKKGKNIGLYQFFFSLSLLVSPAVGTFIYSFDTNLFWYLSGSIGIVSSISFLLLRKNLNNNFLKLSLTD